MADPQEFSKWGVSSAPMESGRYGIVSYLAWCQLEVDRINKAAERHVSVAQQLDKGLCCIVLDPDDKFWEAEV